MVLLVFNFIGSLLTPIPSANETNTFLLFSMPVNEVFSGFSSKTHMEWPLIIVNNKPSHMQIPPGNQPSQPFTQKKTGGVDKDLRARLFKI
jgi:hypothetical protein